MTREIDPSIRARSEIREQMASANSKQLVPVFNELSNDSKRVLLDFLAKPAKEKGVSFHVLAESDDEIAAWWEELKDAQRAEFEAHDAERRAEKSASRELVKVALGKLASHHAKAERDGLSIGAFEGKWQGPSGTFNDVEEGQTVKFRIVDDSMEKTDQGVLLEFPQKPAPFDYQTLMNKEPFEDNNRAYSRLKYEADDEGRSLVKAGEIWQYSHDTEEDSAYGVRELVIDAADNTDDSFSPDKKRGRRNLPMRYMLPAGIKAEIIQHFIQMVAEAKPLETTTSEESD